MATEIPITNASSFTEDVVIDNVVYSLHFKWNGRAKAWIMDIAAQDGETLISGLKILPSWELIEIYTNTKLPPGNIFILDTDNTDVVPGRFELGNRVKLIYFTEDE